MNDNEMKKNAKEFIQRWDGKGHERAESQKFWIDLLTNVYNVRDVNEFIDFESSVPMDKSTAFLDGFINTTKTLIEQKSINKDLRKPILQSDGSLLNPFQQAKRYSAERPYDLRPRWIVTCNFKSFLIYDMNNPNSEPEEVLQKNLHKEYYRLSFLVDKKNDHIRKEEELSFKAGELVGKIYDSFYKEYKNIENEQTLKDLNELCVRLVFCLYSEDAGLFGKKRIFHDYLSKNENLDVMRKALIDLFKVLDTPLDKRDPYMDEDLNQFPYVNGGLFSNENIEIPKFNDEIKNMLLSKASDDFDWSEISPTIFGAVFESTLNPETRRTGGMHYTSIENIHKVIDPLFINDLREKLDNAENYKNEKTRNEKLFEFQNHISSLKFFDPACGSGNFLTETYLTLRRMENEALSIISNGSMMLDIKDIIKVSIQQFYGIEINDFAVKVAKTALWIAEAQMWTETRNLISNNDTLTDFLPLEAYINIVEDNALKIEWKNVLDPNDCNYIMGNPPFIGGMYMEAAQKKDLLDIFDNYAGAGKFDYVTAWYFKGCQYIKNTNIKMAFVSTNSICQGEQVLTFWNYIFKKFNIEIFFAYQSFNWNSEASDKAKVHCVVVGLQNKNINQEKILFFDTNNYKKCYNINPYLVDGETFFLELRKDPICKVPSIKFGNMPRDGGNFVISEIERKNIIKLEPFTEKWIKEYIGAEEFINNKKRYCFWLHKEDKTEIAKSKIIMDRITKVREFRLNSKAEGTRKYASIPSLFCQIAHPYTDYLVIPKTSSGKRRYLPIGFMNKDVIASDLVFIVPNASCYDFAILSSNVHMAWLRIVGGRLKSDYRYSKDIVYNNFPWPEVNEIQKSKVIETGKRILDIRKKYENVSLAELYGPNMILLYTDLLRAHQDNDKAVYEAYGKKWDIKSEASCVSELLKLYKNLIENK